MSTACQQIGVRMTFSIGDRVISGRVRGRIGLVVRIRKLAALCLVQFSPNLRMWIDEEDMQPAPASMAPPNPENCRRWFDGHVLSKDELDRHAAIIEIRERASRKPSRARRQMVSADER